MDSRHQGPESSQDPAIPGEDALHRLAEELPQTWLDVASGERSFDEVFAAPALGEGVDGLGDLGDLGDLESLRMDDLEGLRLLLEPLEIAVEERVASHVVAGFLGDGASRVETDLGVVIDGPRLVTEAVPELAVVERRWWMALVPLAAAAIVLFVIIDGPGLSALYDGSEGRVRPSNVVHEAVAASVGSSERGQWPAADTAIPGAPVGGAEVPLSEEKSPSEAAVQVTISVPGGVPSGVQGSAPGGVIGGALGGALGGAWGGTSAWSEGQVGDPGAVPRQEGAESGQEGAESGQKGAEPGGTASRSASIRVARAMPIEAVMAHSLYTPDPEAKALAGTKAGLFDRRPCTSVIAFCVDEKGVSRDVHSERSCYDPKVDEVCRLAVKKWRFKPFIVNGDAQEICTEVSFDLRFGSRH